MATKIKPALFARPIYRLRLVRPDETQLGYKLIDVIAILPSRGMVGDSKFPFPYLVCLALTSAGTWTTTEITDGDGHCDLAENYEVVS